LVIENAALTAFPGVGRIKMRCYGVILLACFSVSNISSATVSRFEGDWEVHAVVRVPEGEPEPQGTEVKYPVRLTIAITEGKVSGTYKDQFGFEGPLAVAVLLNEGQDLIIACAGTTKEGSAFAPIHHLKVVDDALVGVVLARTRLFEWRAHRVKP